VGIDYNRMFSEAKAELAKLQVIKQNLESELADVDSKIGAMTKTYNAIAPIVGQHPLPTIKDALIHAGIEALKAAGISIAVRSVVDSSPQEFFTAAMIRDRLAEKGWNWGEYVNPLATVHTVLVRLAESGAIKETMKDGKKAFHSSKRIEPLAAPIPTLRGLAPVPDLDAIGPPQSVQGLEQSKRKR